MFQPSPAHRVTIDAKWCVTVNKVYHITFSSISSFFLSIEYLLSVSKWSIWPEILVKPWNMIVKYEKQILIFLHHFQEHCHPFSFQKVVDSKDFYSNTSSRTFKMKYIIWIFGHSIKYDSKKQKFFLYFLHHFLKNFIFTSFSDPPNNRIWSSKIFFTYRYYWWKYTLLCPRK